MQIFPLRLWGGWSPPKKWGRVSRETLVEEKIGKGTLLAWEQRGWGGQMGKLVSQQAPPPPVLAMPLS